MPASNETLNPSRRLAALPLLGLLLLLILPIGAPAAVRDEVQAFRILNATARLSNGVYHLDAEIDYRLSDAVIEALDNGVALTIVLEVEVQRPRRWLWPKLITRFAQRGRLDYRALSDQYVITDLDTAQQRNYPSRHAAVAALGTIAGLPIVEQRLLQGEAHHVRIRTYLDIDTLPLPLRPMAYLSGAWQLGSGWYTWSLDN